MSARRNRLASLAVVVAAVSVALFAGGAAFPSQACAGVTSEAPSAPATVYNGTCGQKDPIFTYFDKTKPLKTLKLKNTGAWCDLGVGYLVRGARNWTRVRVKPGAGITVAERFKEIKVFCLDARDKPPCSADITVS